MYLKIIRKNKILTIIKIVLLCIFHIFKRKIKKSIFVHFVKFHFQVYAQKK